MVKKIYQMIEHHANALQLCRRHKIVATDDEQRCQVDSGVLVGLHLETPPVPVNSLKLKQK